MPCPLLLLQRSKVGQTSWDCQEELFRQEVENADDLRLSYRLMRKCMGDKQKFCADIKPGAPPACRCVFFVADCAVRGIYSSLFWLAVWSDHDCDYIADVLTPLRQPQRAACPMLHCFA